MKKLDDVVEFSASGEEAQSILNYIKPVAEYLQETGISFDTLLWFP